MYRVLAPECGHPLHTHIHTYAHAHTRAHTLTIHTHEHRHTQGAQYPTPHTFHPVPYRLFFSSQRFVRASEFVLRVRVRVRVKG